jgi:hypothetical protein
MRKTAITAVFTMFLSGSGSAMAQAPVCGDVNDSGSVTVADALFVLREAVGQSPALQCAPPSLPARTGQVTCYDAAGKLIACAGTGQDGESQTGVVRSFTDNGDGTIDDHTTGLMWEKLSDDGSIHDYTTTYAWADAFASKVAVLNSTGFAGHDDWRLPNILELESLRNYGAADPSVFSVFDSACAADCSLTNCSCTQAGYYWSSTTQLSQSTFAWHVSFLKGTTYPRAKTELAYVRAVRGGQG